MGISRDADNAITAVLNGQENIDGFNKILSEGFGSLVMARLLRM
jgi:hypothetical protein